MMDYAAFAIEFLLTAIQLLLPSIPVLKTEEALFTFIAIVGQCDSEFQYWLTPGHLLHRS